MAVKKLSELTVAELKHELKKRKLDFTGEKGVLLARLRKSLIEDANKAKLAQQQKAKDEEKKSAEETPVDQKKPENDAPPASVSEESSKACTAETDSSFNLSVSENLAKDSSGHVATAAADEPVREKDDLREKEDVETEKSQGSTSAVVESVEHVAPLENVEADAGSHDSHAEVAESSDGKVGTEVKEDAEKMECDKQEETKVGTEESMPQLNESEQTLSKDSECKAEDKICDIKQENDDVSELKVKSEPSSDTFNDQTGTGLSEDGAGGSLAVKEEPMEDQQSDSVHKTETEKPEALENAHVTVATTATVPQINEAKEAPAQKPVPSKNSLWVSGMVGVVKASELKQAFNEFGRVISAKIVTSAKCPGSRCFGLVTMYSHEDALKCIEGYNGKKLLGSLVTVELDTKHRVTRPQSLASNEQNKNNQTPVVVVEAQKPIKEQEVKLNTQQTPTKLEDNQKVTPNASETLPTSQPGSAAVKPPGCTTPGPSAPVKASLMPTPVKSEPKILPLPAASTPKPVSVVPATATPAVSKPVDAAAIEKQEVSTSVWLSGFPNTIKAAELKAFCLSAGKVLAAKVVANAKLQTYYGLVTMATVDDAHACLKKINNTMYNNKFKITCEMSPSNTVTSELLKHFSKNKTEQTPQTPSVVKAPIVQPKIQVAVTVGGTTATTTVVMSTTPKPAGLPIVAKPTASSTPAKPLATPPAATNNAQKKPEQKNANKKGKKKGPLMKTPQSANRNFRRPSPKGRNSMRGRGEVTNRYGGRSFPSTMDNGMMGRSQFGAGGRGIMDDRRSLVYLEEERRLAQEMAMINVQREKLQIESLRLEREREKMEAERMRQEQMRRNEWKPLQPPVKRPHEEDICWRPPPQSAAKRFAASSEYESFAQAGGSRRPPLLDDREVRHFDRGMGGPSLLGPRGVYPMGQNQFQDYY